METVYIVYMYTIGTDVFPSCMRPRHTTRRVMCVPCRSTGGCISSRSGIRGLAELSESSSDAALNIHYGYSPAFPGLARLGPALLVVGRILAGAHPNAEHR